MKYSWMRKKDRPVGEEEKRGAEEINAASLHSCLSLAKKLPSSLALEAAYIRQAGCCAIVVCAAATSARHFAGSLSDILVRMIFWGVLSALYNKHNSCSKVLARCNIVVSC
jgi:hypothetical protein